MIGRRTSLFLVAVALVVNFAVIAAADTGIVSDTAVARARLKALNQEWQGLVKQRRFSEAHAAAIEADRLWVRAWGSDSLARVYALRNRANVYEEEGLLIEAEPFLRRVLEIQERSPGFFPHDIAMTLNHLGLLYKQLGRYAEAENLLRRSIALQLSDWGGSMNSPRIAPALDNLAMLYLDMGRYAEAESYGRRVVRIYERAARAAPRRTADLEIALSNMACLMMDQKRHDEAERFLLRALSLMESRGDATPEDRAAPLNNLANVHVAQARLAEAESTMLRALEIDRNRLGPDHPDLAASLGNVAQIYSLRGRLDEADDLFLRSLAIRLRALGVKHPDVAAAYQSLGFGRRDRGETAAAIARFREALDVLAVADSAWDGSAGSLRPLPLTIGTLRALSRAEASDTRMPERDRLRRALATARGALDVLERMRRTMTGKDRRAHEEKFRDLPGWILSLQVELQSLGEPVDSGLTLRSAEAASAWSFLEMMAEARVDAAMTDALSPDLARTERELLARINSLDAHPGDTTLFFERSVLEDSFTAYVERLYREAPRYGAIKYPRPAPIETVRAALAPDEAALEYVVSPHGSFVLALTRDSFLLAKIGSESGTMDALAAYDAAVGHRQFSPDDRSALRRVHDFLLKRVGALVEGRTLVVAPSDALERVSFAALLAFDTQSPGSPREIMEIPSLSILALTRSWRVAEPAAARALLAIGDPVYGGRIDAAATMRSRAYSSGVRSGWVPLPGTGVEARLIARYFGDTERKVLLGRQATESRVMSADWRGYGHLHFACHGALEEGPGREPALVLSLSGNAPPSDGFLSLREVVGRPMRARTTVLSACNSGRSSTGSRRSGVSNLARAFLLAGSDAVIVSVRPVSDDATAALMSEFYRATREDGLTASRALAKAQEMMRARGDWSAPYYWAPFICVGE